MNEQQVRNTLQAMDADKRKEKMSYKTRNSKVKHETPIGERNRYRTLKVWTDEFGEVPWGCEIHHRDFNPANDDIYNLECITWEHHKFIHHVFGKNRKQ